MTPNYAYTPDILPSFCTVIFLILLSIYSGRHRSVPSALPFLVGCVFATLWATGSLMEYAAVNLADKIFWYKFESCWRLPATTASLCFALEYTWPGRWLTRRNLILLSIPCLLVVGVILTDNTYHLVWDGFAQEGIGIFPLRSKLNWLYLAYGYGLGVINLVIFAWLFIRSPQHRWPISIMMVGQILGRGFYLLDVIQVYDITQHVNVPPIAFEYLFYAIALFGFRFLDPIPLAQRAAIEQMHAGMLVLDSLGRIVNLNPAAERILTATAKQLKGKQVGDLLPASHAGQFIEEAETEIRLPAGQELRYYTLAVSALTDWRGLKVGQLLLIRDVTEQKWSQAQVIEQQKVVATLHEREQLARELHDSLGQVLGYISLQTQAIRKRLHDGQTDTAAIEMQLTRLAEVAQEAHRDVRESIFNLRAGAAESWSFFASLRGQLASFQEHYGIQTKLILPEGLTETVFEMHTTVQLLRVIQEALTNTRKHGYASHVQVSFACQGDQVEITIADNGRGFDLCHIGADGESHLGLAFMRERMEQINGSLEVEAEPGMGTRVMLRVAMREGHKEALG